MSNGSTSLSPSDQAQLSQLRKNLPATSTPIKVGSVYKVHLGRLPDDDGDHREGAPVVGHEFGDYHFVVVVSNISDLRLCQVVPFTSSPTVPPAARSLSVRVDKGSWGAMCTKDGWALPYHIRTISHDRFIRDAEGQLKSDIFTDIQAALMDVLGIT